METTPTTIAGSNSCAYCSATLPEGANFCPKCGKETAIKKMSLFSIALALAVSLFLAPFGLVFAARYLKRPERNAKVIGILCVVFTAVSIILTLVVAKNFINTYYGSLNSLESIL